MKLPASPTDSPRCLFQQLAAHVYSPVLPETDLDLMDHLAGKSKWAPKFFQNKTPLIKTCKPKRMYILMETGTHFSEEYQNKTLLCFRKAGFSSTFLQIITAAQHQGINTLMFSKRGCYPDPRTPPLLKTPLNPVSPHLLEDLESFHSQYPIELLTNILNYSGENTPKTKN